MDSGIYTITNKANGKIYVGYSISMSRRMYQHKRSLRVREHSNPHLQSAYDCYGEDCFEFEVLEYHEEMSVLPSIENYWVNMLRSNDREYGYNIACTSDRHEAYKWSDETRQKMMKRFSEGNHPAIGFKHSEETKKIWSEQRRGRKFSDEAKAAMSMGQKLAYTDERREKISKARKGRKHTDETKRILSEKAKQKVGENASNYGNRREKNPMTKKVIDTVTGIIYPSMWHAAEAHGTTYDNLRRRLGGRRKNNTTLVYLENYKNEH